MTAKTLIRAALLCGVAFCVLGLATSVHAESAAEFSYEINQGLAPAAFHFMGGGAKGRLAIGCNVAAVWSQGRLTTWRFAGAAATCRPQAVDPLPGVSRYYLGDDPSHWQTSVRKYAAIRLNGVYPGVDIVWRSEDGLPVFDFELAPNAAPERIRLELPREPGFAVEEDGRLRFGSADAPLHLAQPRSYQRIAGRRMTVKSHFVVRDGEVGIELGDYDGERPLTIDPTLVFGTYLGAAGKDAPSAVAIDSEGNLYAVGRTESPEFPTTMTYDAASRPLEYNPVGFVSKMSPDGTELLFSVFLGGRLAEADPFEEFQDTVTSIDLGPDGSIYVGGSKQRANFPTTLQEESGGAQGVTVTGFTDGFVAKLSSDGKLLYSKLIGATANERVMAVAALEDGGAVATGWTNSADFPVTGGAYQTFHADADSRSGFADDWDCFVAKLDPSGRVTSSTYVGGPGRDEAKALEIDADGVVWIIGAAGGAAFPTTPDRLDARDPALAGEAFLAALDPELTRLAFGSFVGGSGFDSVGAMALDDQGALTLLGSTGSEDFPVVNAPYDFNLGRLGNAFLMRFDVARRAVDYAVVLPAIGSGVAAGPNGTSIVTLMTWYADAPDAFPERRHFGGGWPNGPSLTKFDSTGLPLWTTVLGIGHPLRVAFAPPDRIGLAGEATRLGAELSAGAFQTAIPGAPVLILRSLRDNAGLTQNGLRNAAGYQGGGVAPGEIVVLFGGGLGPPELTLSQVVDGRFETKAADVQVLFDGEPAPLIYVSQGQVSAIVPYSVAGKTDVRVRVFHGQTRTEQIRVPVVEAQPALFTFDSSGAGPAAILNEDASVNTAANPAAQRSIVVLFGTGEGQTEPAGQDGLLATQIYPKPLLPVRVEVSGREAEILYAGAAPRLVAGVLQVNVRLPAGLPAGPVEVVLYVGGVASPAGVTVFVE